MGGKMPDRVVQPVTEREAAEVLLQARTSGDAVVPVGGATMLEVGAVPTSYSVAVSTVQLTGIVEYNPGDLTLVVRAGTTLAEVAAELRSHGQFLSVQAPYPELATIGGTLAANASGPLRLAYGSARDAVIGTRVALPNGEIAKSGGRVVKNVAGYDLSKLFIGSFGTLGIIVEAAFKVHPQPLTRRTLIVPAADVAAAMLPAAKVAHIGPGLLALAVVNAGLARAVHLDGPAVVIVVGGPASVADELVEDVRAASKPLTAKVLDADEGGRMLAALQDFPGRANLRLSDRSSLPHIMLADAGDTESLIYPTIGSSWASGAGLGADDVASLRRETARSGGGVVVWHRTPALASVPTWGEVGPEIALMRSIKSVFDPQRVMSPGRFVGDI